MDGAAAVAAMNRPAAARVSDDAILKDSSSLQPATSPPAAIQMPPPGLASLAAGAAGVASPAGPAHGMLGLSGLMAPGGSAAAMQSMMPLVLPPTAAAVAAAAAAAQQQQQPDAPAAVMVAASPPDGDGACIQGAGLSPPGSTTAAAAAAAVAAVAAAAGAAQPTLADGAAGAAAAPPPGLVAAVTPAADSSAAAAAAAAAAPLALPADAAACMAAALAAQQPAAQHALLAVSPPSGSTAAAAQQFQAGGGMLVPGGASVMQASAPAATAHLGGPLLMAAGLSTATALMPTGATPAQLAGGMPAMQAVPVIVTSHQAPASQPYDAASQAFAAQTLDMAGSLAQSSSVSAASLSTPSISAFGGVPSIAGSLSSLLSGAGGPQTPATCASGLQPGSGGTALNQLAVAQQQQAVAAQQVQQQQATVAALVTSGADLTSPGVSCTLTKLAMARQQEHAAAMTAASLQAAAAIEAANSAMAAAGGSSSCTLPPASMVQGSSVVSDISNLSLSNLRSASVASSITSVPPISTGLEPIRSITGSLTGGASGSSSASKKVRVLLSSGGECQELAPSSEGSGSCTTRWRYVGGETRLVGLAATTSYSSFLQQLSKVTQAVWDESCRLMYDLPSSSSDNGLLVDLIDDEDLDCMWDELESATALKPGYRLHLYAQLGSKRSSAGAGASSIASDEQHSSSEVHSASTPRAASAVAAATAAAAGVSSDGGARGTAGGSSGTAAASDGGGGGSSGTPQFTSSELNELDIVSDTPSAINLSELESKLEVIRPEELEPVRLLGSGGFGEVYLCRWHSCEVAVKCLNPTLLVPDGGMGSFSKDNVSELLKEAAIMASLRHPSVVWVYGLVLPPLDPHVEAVRAALGPGQHLDAVKVMHNMVNRHRTEAPTAAIRPPALVTEFLASGSLRSAISRRADFMSKDSVRIKLALDAARGMEYLHAKQLVHFDLKSANLLVGIRDKTPICKVADFGLSKRRQQTFVTGVATLRGTLPWVAPEVIKTPTSVTQAVDVFSFGVVLWELWTLQEPFSNLNPHALLHMMSTSTEAVRPPMPGSPEFEGEAGSEPAPGWRGLIEECLSSEPERRPTFKQLVERLDTMLRQNRLAKKQRAASSPPTAPGPGAEQHGGGGSSVSGTTTTPGAGDALARIGC